MRHRGVGGRDRNGVPKRIASEKRLSAGGIGQQVRPSQGQWNGHRCRGAAQLHPEGNHTGVLADRFRLWFGGGLRCRSVEGLRRWCLCVGHCGQSHALGQRNARVAKRLKHALKFHVRHEAELAVFLAVELAQTGQFHRVPSVEVGLHLGHQSFDRLKRVGVRGAVLGHELVGHKAVVGGQARVEQHVA